MTIGITLMQLFESGAVLVVDAAPVLELYELAEYLNSVETHIRELADAGSPSDYALFHSLMAFSNARLFDAEAAETWERHFDAHEVAS